jgi:hypothetical protein
MIWRRISGGIIKFDKKKMAKNIKKGVRHNCNQTEWSNLSDSQKEKIVVGLFELKNNEGINRKKAMLTLSEKYGLLQKVK